MYYGIQKLKFLYVCNYLKPGFSFGNWVTENECKLCISEQTIAFKNNATVLKLYIFIIFHKFCD